MVTNKCLLLDVTESTQTVVTGKVLPVESRWIDAPITRHKNRDAKGAEG